MQQAHHTRAFEVADGVKDLLKLQRASEMIAVADGISGLQMTSKPTWLARVALFEIECLDFHVARKGLKKINQNPGITFQQNRSVIKCEIKSHHFLPKK